MSKELINLDEAVEGVEPSQAKMIQNTFSGIADVFDEYEERYNSILAKAEDVISDEVLTEAKRLRLDLVNIRTNTEKKRVEMKAPFLRMGRAIDGAANLLKVFYSDKEQKLLDIEKTFERQEEARKDKMEEQRRKQISKYVEDPNSLPLREMSQEVWESVLQGKIAIYEQEQKRLQEEEARLKKEEAEKKAREEAERKKRAEERERLKKLEAEREAERKRLAEAEAKAQEERLERERLEREKAEREAEAERQRIAREKAEAEAEAERKKLQAEREAFEKAQKEAEAKRKAEAAAEAKRKAKAKAEAEAEKARMRTDKGKAEKMASLMEEALALSFRSKTYKAEADAAKDDLERIKKAFS